MDTPDLCAHLDRLKRLCDRLEDAQDDRERYGELVDLIQAEVNALRLTVCELEGQTER